MDSIKILDHTAKYKVVKNPKYSTQTHKAGTIKIPRLTEYAVTANDIVIAHIPDWVPNPSATANLIVNLLKENSKYKVV
jgi:hypothetical protein